MEENEDAPTKYFHIQACGPAGIAEADGGFAETLFNTCKKYADRNQGFM